MVKQSDESKIIQKHFHLMKQISLNFNNKTIDQKCKYLQSIKLIKMKVGKARYS